MKSDGDCSRHYVKQQIKESLMYQGLFQLWRYFVSKVMHEKHVPWKYYYSVAVASSENRLKTYLLENKTAISVNFKMTKFRSTLLWFVAFSINAGLISSAELRFCMIFPSLFFSKRAISTPSTLLPRWYLPNIFNFSLSFLRVFTQDTCDNRTTL